LSAAFESRHSGSQIRLSNFDIIALTSKIALIPHLYRRRWLRIERRDDGDAGQKRRQTFNLLWNIYGAYDKVTDQDFLANTRQGRHRWARRGSGAAANFLAGKVRFILA
jgi:hypothetical protein